MWEMSAAEWPLIATLIRYKDRLFVGNVFLVCPHHKVLTTALDSIRSWRVPNPCMQALTTAPPSFPTGARLDPLVARAQPVDAPGHGARARLQGSAPWAAA